MMVVAARGEKGRGTEVEEQIEAHQVAIEMDGAIEIGDFEMHMPNAGLGRECRLCHGSEPPNHPLIVQRSMPQLGR